MWGGTLVATGNEKQDAKTFAAWGVDVMKYDWCGARMIYKDADF